MAADTSVFGFGPVREIQRLREIGTVGKLALHIQCPWRLEGADGAIITGFLDLYRYGGPGAEPSDWHHEIGNSRQSAKIDQVLGRRIREDRSYYYASGLIVTQAAQAGTTGDLVIAFNTGHCLRVFPDTADEEQWRLLNSAYRAAHLVFPADGD